MHRYPYADVRSQDGEVGVLRCKAPLTQWTQWKLGGKEIAPTQCFSPFFPEGDKAHDVTASCCAFLFPSLYITANGGKVAHNVMS